MKVMMIPVVIGALGTFQMIIKRAGWVENTEKSSGDLRRFAVTQTPVKVCQLTMEWKTFWAQKDY